MSEHILVSTRKGLFTVERKGGDISPWKIAGAEFLGDNVSLALADSRDGTQYAALDHGHFGVKMHRKRAGGAWEECAAPAYPEKPEGLEDKDPWGREIPWNTVRVWALETDGKEPGGLWCGTIPGGLFHSTDHGTSWEMNRPLWDDPGRQKWMGGGADLPGLHSVCVDPRDPEQVRIAVSCGGVWTTANGGKSWDCDNTGIRAAFMPPEQQYDPGIQDVHQMVQCRTAPERLWVQHHNGIFRSDDAGRNWTEIEEAGPSVFGFAVAVHPSDPDRAWFVPAVKDEIRIPVDGKLVVTRTNDGGRTFESLTGGLPQKHAYDLIYRHGLAIDDTGDRLVIGSTTGGLWVSDDGGTYWHCVSQSLPPIHAVRFA